MAGLSCFTFKYIGLSKNIEFNKSLPMPFPLNLGETTKEDKSQYVLFSSNLIIPANSF